MGCWRASGKKGYSSGDSYRRIRTAASARGRYQSMKLSSLLGMGTAPGT